ncbi:19893_t:CDS:2, partial [Gigaspora margarita]
DLKSSRIKKYSNIQISENPIPIIIKNNMPKNETINEIFRGIFNKWIEFSYSLLVLMEIGEGDDIETSNWNHEFVKDKRVKSHAYKILVELSTIYHKGKPAIIKNLMIAARRSLILVQRLGWQKESTNNNDYYKLSDESLKELEESF